MTAADAVPVIASRTFTAVVAGTVAVAIAVTVTVVVAGAAFRAVAAPSPIPLLLGRAGLQPGVKTAKKPSSPLPKAGVKAKPERHLIAFKTAATLKRPASPHPHSTSPNPPPAPPTA